MALEKYWSGKLCAVPSMLVLCLSALCRIAARQWNSCIYRVNLGKVGAKCKIGMRCTLLFPGKIKLGRNVSIADDVVLGANDSEGFCHIGDDVSIDRACRIDFSGGIEIGSGCTISNSVVIETHSHGYDPKSAPCAVPLIVENNVWIGMKSIILPQVGRIGAGSIVAAGSIVTHPVPSGVIVAGNPARVIKHIR